MVRHAGRFLGVAVALLGLLLVAPPARAQEVDYARLLEIAGEQQLVSLSMTTDALMIALGIESEERIPHLRTNRDAFDKALADLRAGVPELDLSEESKTQLAELLDSALDLWRRTDAVLAAGLDRAAFTDEELLTIAGQSDRIRTNIEEAAKIYEDRARVGQMSSMIDTAIGTTREKRLISQRMTAEFLLVASGLEADRFRRQLIESSADYERRLEGLLNGDVDLLLLPAPTEGLRARLRRLLIAWQEDLEPLLRRAIDGGALTPAQIVEAVALGESISTEANAAIGEYRALRP